MDGGINCGSVRAKQNANSGWDRRRSSKCITTWLHNHHNRTRPRPLRRWKPRTPRGTIRRWVRFFWFCLYIYIYTLHTRITPIKSRLFGFVSFFWVLKNTYTIYTNTTTNNRSPPSRASLSPCGTASWRTSSWSPCKSWISWVCLVSYCASVYMYVVCLFVF
jgi:hypothetical protein